MKRNAGFLWRVSCLSALLGLASLSAQTGAPPQSQVSTPSATITFVQGGDLSVIRNGAPLSLSDPLGFALLEGDQIQTGAKTQVELLLMPRQARVKLAENTVLTISKLGEAGKSSLSLLYGRLRSKVSSLASRTPDFSVQAGAVSAGVRGTDFGCDLVAPRSGSLATAPVLVYCFEGSVVVSPIAEETAPAPATEVLVAAGTMARVEPSSEGAVPKITTTALSGEIERFWHSNEFQALPAIAAAPAAAPAAASAATTQSPGSPAAAPAPAAPVPPAVLLPADELARLRKANASKNAAIGGGLAFAALSAALEGGAAILRSSDPNLADMLALGGLVCAVTGVPVLVVAISVDPFASER